MKIVQPGLAALWAAGVLAACGADLDLEAMEAEDRPGQGPFNTGGGVLTATDTPIDIPDGDPRGITSRIEVTRSGAAATVEVRVDIRHPYRGDLVVRLVCPDGTSVPLHQRQGGSADDLRQTYSVSACAGRSASGTWRLQVADVARHDRGRLVGFALKLGDAVPADRCRPVEGAIDDVYFEDAPAFPWMQCYTVSPAQAAEQIRQGRVGSSVLLPQTVQVSGELIRVRYRYPGVWPDNVVTFRPCVFSKQDSCVYDCAITFQQDTSDFDPGALARKERSCAAAHPTLRGRYIDCAAGVAHPVTNTWRQPVSRMEIKLMQHLLTRPLPSGRSRGPEWLDVPGALLGAVDPVNRSLEACMDWSAQLSFSFARITQTNETCDADMMRVLEDVGYGNVWCPWGMRVVKLSCDGGPQVVNTRNPWNIPLDRNHPEVRALCQGR